MKSKVTDWMVTKHSIRVGQRLFPKGTEILLASLKEMQSVWPSIQPKKSPQIGVWFPKVSHPIIINKQEVQFYVGRRD